MCRSTTLRGDAARLTVHRLPLSVNCFVLPRGILAVRGVIAMRWDFRVATRTLLPAPQPAGQAEEEQGAGGTCPVGD